MIYLLLGTMLLVAVLVIVFPLYRQEKRLSLNSAIGVAVILAVAIPIYAVIGSPQTDSPAHGELPSVDEMVGSLAERLREQPDDLPGWKLLARSYVQMRDFPSAVTAYERAIELEGAQNGQTLADLGEVLMLEDARAIHGRAGQLFENALAVSPNNQKALFYSGMAAAERGERELAAERWETLLATGPPANIQDILRQQIAELRGEPAPVATQPADKALTVRVTLGETAIQEVPADSTVFIIARDPAQPSPPIAAVRRIASELPADVQISDADAMIPGRVPSAFAELEIVARVSMSGNPIAQSGDWFGQQLVATADTDQISLMIDEQVP
ncbi:MAG: hypothetical protein R3192_12805 [Woeseiaceae bacterium]|nr:hypothetical protein [Woeseiaceae bacterium]